MAFLWAMPLVAAAPKPFDPPSQKRLPLFPEVDLGHPRNIEGSTHLSPVSGRIALTKFWFENQGNICGTAIDSLALLWFTTRLVFVCPYGSGRTRLGVELAPEIQWPTGESLSLLPRPGMRIAHIQNTALAEGLFHFFRVSYKLAWQDRAQARAPSFGFRSVSPALIQDWSDLFDSAYGTGLVYSFAKNAGAGATAAIVFDFEQTLPLALREWGVIRQSALAKWTRLGVGYRQRSGSWSWGMGLNYGSLAFEWVQFSMFYPEFHFGFDTDSKDEFPENQSVPQDANG
jgi:hypothetical protein